MSFPCEEILDDIQSDDKLMHAVADPRNTRNNNNDLTEEKNSMPPSLELRK